MLRFDQKSNHLHGDHVLYGSYGGGCYRTGTVWYETETVVPAPNRYNYYRYRYQENR